jgi:hypothetical protein
MGINMKVQRLHENPKRKFDALIGKKSAKACTKQRRPDKRDWR